MQNKRGFTLIELLVVVSIIALLVSILLPALSKARMQAYRTMCQTNLHAMINGAHVYAADYGEFPQNYANKAACVAASYSYLPYLTSSVMVLVSQQFLPDYEVFKCPWTKQAGFYTGAIRDNAVYSRASNPNLHSSLEGMPRRMDYFYVGGSFVTPSNFAPTPVWARNPEAGPEKTIFADYCNMGYNFSIAGNHGPNGFTWSERLNQGSFVANVRGNVAWKDQDYWTMFRIRDYWWKFGNSYYFAW